MRYDVAVVGGGISGLATAEIFARSGYSVALVEKNEQLCSETSGAHHEWFHFGSLYSIFPSPQFLRTLVGGIDDILVYYRDFNGMNLRIQGDGSLHTVTKKNSWLRHDTLDYAVATTKDPDFSLDTTSSSKEKLRRFVFKRGWDKVVRQFIARHDRFCSYDWRRGCASYYIGQQKWTDILSALAKTRPFRIDGASLNPDTHFQIDSYDRPMTAHNIISDLTRSFLSHGGEIWNCKQLLSYKSSAAEVELELQGEGSPEVLKANQAVICTGKGLQEFLPIGMKLKTVASPLLVAYPHVCESNVVRLIPFVERTVNHLKHATPDGTVYSLIGGGFFCDPDDQEAKERLKLQLLRRAVEVFPRMAQASYREVYFSNKSELSSSLTKRNYLYRIEKIAPNVWVTVPGKFSLCFSLAVNTFRELRGHYPSTFVDYDFGMDVSKMVGVMKHKQLVAQHRGFTTTIPGRPREVAARDSVLKPLPVRRAA